MIYRIMHIEQRVIYPVAKANGGAQITEIKRDLHNSSDHEKAKSNYGFIIHSK